MSRATELIKKLKESKIHEIAIDTENRTRGLPSKDPADELKGIQQKRYELGRNQRDDVHTGDSYKELRRLDNRAKKLLNKIK